MKVSGRRRGHSCEPLAAVEVHQGGATAAHRGAADEVGENANGNLINLRRVSNMLVSAQEDQTG